MFACHGLDLPSLKMVKEKMYFNAFTADVGFLHPLHWSFLSFLTFLFRSRFQVEEAVAVLQAHQGKTLEN